MKSRLPAVALLILTAAILPACYGPAYPPPPGRGRGRSLDVPPRYGVPPEQSQYFEGVDMTDPNAAVVQPPDPNAPVTGDNVTPPPTTGNTAVPPPVTVTPPGTTPPPAPAPTPPPAPTEIPYATRITGKPGFVKSPFDPNGQAIDVRDFQSGQKARCPYTGKIFRVP
jgi:hypothetical protein